MLKKRLYCLQLCIVLLCAVAFSAYAEDGYRLWLRYTLIKDKARLEEYKSGLRYLVIEKSTPTLAVITREVTDAVKGFTGGTITPSATVKEGSVVAVLAESPLLKSLPWAKKLTHLGAEGFRIESVSLQGK